MGRLKMKTIIVGENYFSMVGINLLLNATVITLMLSCSIFLLMPYCEQDLASLLDNMQKPFTEAQVDGCCEHC